MDPSSACSFFLRAGLIGLLFLPSTEADGGVSATCGGCMALSLWSPFSPAQTRARRDVRFAQAHPPNPGRSFFIHPTHRLRCNRLPWTRPFPRWRWRDATFEGPFGRSPGRTKFAEPSNDRAVRFIQRWSKRRPSTFCAPFLVCALSEQRRPVGRAISPTPGGGRARKG
jgi:hypothetical protein